MPEGYHHVTRDIRCQIYALKATGISLRKIAEQLGKSVSTISRELKRNRGGNGYRYQQADRLACERRSNASQAPKKLIPEVVNQITEGLREEWSPEQLSGRLEAQELTISHETIYRYVWNDKREGGTLYTHLRRHGKRYNKRSSGKAGRGCIPGRVDITARPKIVEEKARKGDWEADTVISTASRTALLTLVDRRSKYTIIHKLGEKTAENVYQAITKRLSALPRKVHTITYDNGSEFSAHEKISLALNSKAYFATPYHSWERGLNEHTNGLIRQYLPKSFDFKEVTDEEIQAIENKLNNRPRKVLNYKTPREIFFANIKTTTNY
jgi:IS30 family transposase